MMQLSSLVQNNSVLVFLIQVIFIYFLREILIYQLRKRRVLFYLILYPGIIMHEVGHLLGCFIADAKVRSYKLVSSTGGEVVHEKSKLPVIGNFLISIFPLILGSISIYFISTSVLGDALNNLAPVYSILLKLLSLYLMVAILLTMFPSWQDISNSTFGYLILSMSFILVVILTTWKMPANLIGIGYFCLGALVVLNLIMLIVNNVRHRR